jgi:hypothetical protein
VSVAQRLGVARNPRQHLLQALVLLAQRLRRDAHPEAGELAGGEPLQVLAHLTLHVILREARHRPNGMGVANVRHAHL